jgi:hypothetical protein
VFELHLTNNFLAANTLCQPNRHNKKSIKVHISNNIYCKQTDNLLVRSAEIFLVHMKSEMVQTQEHLNRTFLI